VIHTHLYVHIYVLTSYYLTTLLFCGRDPARNKAVVYFKFCVSQCSRRDITTANSLISGCTFVLLNLPQLRCEHESSCSLQLAFGMMAIANEHMKQCMFKSEEGVI
jgi:hypothetical protein